jgi:hypothetical protein
MIDEITAMETLEKRFKRFKEKNKKIFEVADERSEEHRQQLETLKKQSEEQRELDNAIPNVFSFPVLLSMDLDLLRRIAIVWGDERIRTHSDACWKWHPECAVEILMTEIRLLSDEVDGLLTQSTSWSTHLDEAMKRIRQQYQEIQELKSVIKKEEA